MRQDSFEPVIQAILKDVVMGNCSEDIAIQRVNTIIGISEWERSQIRQAIKKALWDSEQEKGGLK